MAELSVLDVVLARVSVWWIVCVRVCVCMCVTTAASALMIQFLSLTLMTTTMVF